MKAISALIVIGLWIAVILGWILNFVAILKGPPMALWAGMEIARLIGVFIPIVGAILGYI